LPAPPGSLFPSSDITQGRKGEKGVGEGPAFFHRHEGVTAIDHKKRQNQKMVDMCGNVELGLIPKTVYEINGNFFEEFK